MIGRQLNHYTVLEKLGEGGMAQVYLARDNRLGRRVALKVLPDEMAQDERRIERFEREAKVVAALNHPNIVTIYSVEEADGVRFLTMELVDGRSLDEIIPEDGLDLASFYRLALPLLDAVDAAHRRGVTHRDLKPANVMVNSEGVVKLLDLGLAKLNTGLGWDGDAGAETLTRQGRAIGTVPYMAPEQLAGEPIDHRVDIFALGVVLYEMLSCRRPFVGATSSEVISAILEESPKPITELRPDLPAALAQVVEHCLEKEPGERFQSARELRQTLARLASRDGSSFEQTTGRETIRARGSGLPSGRRNQWLLAAAITAAVAVVAATVFSRLSPRPTSNTSPAASSAVLSLAVSPLTYESRGDAPTFARQLEREIVSRLSAIEGLDLVASPGRAATLPPDADYLLWGAVNWLDSGTGDSPSDGARVRASFGLLRTADDRDIWTESFDRPADALGLARREIALLVESRVGRLLGFPIPEVPDLGPSGGSRAPAARPAVTSEQEPSAPPTLPEPRLEAASAPSEGDRADASEPIPTSRREMPQPPGEVAFTLELRSDVANGTLTIYAGERQIYRDTFHFTEPREGVLGRLGVREKAGGELRQPLAAAANTEELRVYLALGDEPARHVALEPVELSPSTRLVVDVGAEGSLAAHLE